jgi:hypothetical protein
MPVTRQRTLEYMKYNRLDFNWEEPDGAFPYWLAAHLVDRYNEYYLSQ